MLTQKKTVQYQSIKSEEYLVRIDRYLHQELQIPKTYIYKLIRTGQIRVNQKRINIQYRLKLNDTIRIPPFQNIILSKKNIKPAPLKKHIQLLEKNVLYEDSHLLIINKPAHLATQGGSGIVHSLDQMLQSFRNVDFIQPAHRIDQATTGCLIIAKRRSIIRKLHVQFQNQNIQKHYLAICKNSWENKYTVIKKPLLQIKKNHQEQMKTCEQGKICESHFIVQVQNKSASLCQIILKTGRKHQIRAHASDANHPILGDNKYGDFNWNKTYHFTNFLFLHAHEVIFSHPQTNEPLHIQAPIPSYWKLALQTLDLNKPKNPISTQTSP